MPNRPPPWRRYRVTARDTVVLQEQSRLPAIQDQRDVQMVPAIRLLDEQIKENGAETILIDDLGIAGWSS